MPSRDPFSTAQIDRLLRPRSVAIVGASATPGSLSGAVLANLERAGYTGSIHLINPKRSEIGGRSCLASIDDLPDAVDCAVLVIPRAGVVEAVAACGRRGVGGVIVFSSGFAEAGDEGRADQERVRLLAAQYGMVVEGPNCLGLVNYVAGVPLTFVSTDMTPPTGSKGIAILSQSGAMAAVLGVSLRDRALGISYSISTGNEAASGVEDYLDFVLTDPNTGVVVMIVEQFREPQRFLE